MKCPNCQFDIPEGSNFCSKCGTSLTAATSVLTALNEKIDKIQRYLPQGLTEKILDQKGKIEGERKQVTVLFCDLVGYTSIAEKLGPEDTYAIMDQVLEILIHKVHDYGGTVNQLLGDGLYALFGVPIAIEDASSRAIRAGIEMQKDIIEFSEKTIKEKNFPPLRMRIGINSGPVVVGTIGNSLRVEFKAVGDTVNLASRMEGLAEPGTVFVTQETYKRARLYFNFEAYGEKTIKGKEKPVSVYKVISEKEKIHRRLSSDRIIQSEMVSRETEMDKLELAVVKAKNGEGSIVNVIGEAGIGKSRLIAELKASDVVKRTTILEGRALSMGRNLSFYPIIEILKGFAGITEDDIETRQLQKLETAVRNIHPEEAKEIVPFIATLMGMNLAGEYAERIKGFEGEALEKLIYKNLRELILKSTEITPLIFIIEDLHWADSSSIELIISLFRLTEENRLLIINVFRPHYSDTGEVLQKAVKESFSGVYTEISLHRLNSDQSDLLIDNLLKIEGLPIEMREQIRQRSEGNPFFIEEMIRSLIDEGAVELISGRFTITEKINSAVIPHTIQELLMSRIDRLDEHTKALIRNASVIGRHFFYKILTEVATTTEEIDSRLEYLKDVQLIRESKRLDEVEYLFKHALAQEATYESILVQKRKELHLSVANAIEKTFNERLHEFYGMLAYHYSRGDNLIKTEEYMLKAGEEALKSSASSEAINYYQSILDLYAKKYQDKVDRLKLAEMEIKLALALNTRGDYVQSVHYLDKAIEKMGLGQRRKGFLFFISMLKNILLFLFDIYFPSNKKKKTPTDSENREHSLYLDRCRSLVAIDPERSFIEVLLPYYKRRKFDISSSQVMFDSYAGNSMLFTWSGVSFKLGRRIINNAKNSLKENGGDISSIMLDLVDMVELSFSGSWRHEFDETVIESALHKGDTQGASGYQLFSGHMHIGLGNFEIVNRIEKQLLEMANSFNDDHARSDYLEIRSTSLIKRNMAEVALDDIKANISLMEKVEQDARKITFLGMRMQIEVLQENLEEAEKTKQEADDLIVAAGKISVIPLFYSRYAIGVLMLRTSNLEEAKKSGDSRTYNRAGKALIKAISDAQNSGKKFAPIRIEAGLLAGRAYWMIGKRGKAFSCWRKTIQEGQKMGAKPDLSRTYLEVGKRLLEPQSKYKQLNGITAEEYFKKAESLFEEMDLKWDLEQLEKVKETIR